MKESTGEEWKGEEESPDIIDINGSAPKDSYVLDGEIVRKPKSYKEFLTFMKSDGRRVALGFVRSSYVVSTVFLGLDRNYTGKGSPILFETMVFHNGGDTQKRYSTYEEALTGHREELEFLKIAIANGM